MSTKLGKINFDSTVYTTEEVDELLKNKQDSLFIDSTPTKGSTNPVSSGGVYTVINDGLDKKLDIEHPDGGAAVGWSDFYGDPILDVTISDNGGMRSPVYYTGDGSDAILDRYGLYYNGDFLRLGRNKPDSIMTSKEVDDKISAAMSSTLNFRGSVATYEDLPTNAKNGDVYNVESTGMNYAWVIETVDNEEVGKWDALGPTLSGYATKDEVNAEVSSINTKLDDLDNTKLSLTGGTVTGAVTVSNGTSSIVIDGTKISNIVDAESKPRTLTFPAPVSEDSTSEVIATREYGDTNYGRLDTENTWNKPQYTVGEVRVCQTSDHTRNCMLLTPTGIQTFNDGDFCVGLWNSYNFHILPRYGIKLRNGTNVIATFTSVGTTFSVPVECEKNLSVYGDTTLHGKLWIDNSNDLDVAGNAEIGMDTTIYGNATVYGSLYVGSNDIVESIGQLTTDTHNRITEVAENISNHTSNTGNPHGVTAAQVGADTAGTAASAVNAHNESESAHADIRKTVSDAIVHLGSVGEKTDLVSGVLETHIDAYDNPHSVTELQVLTATTEKADRSFVRADYNYADRPYYIDAKVTDLILFQGRNGYPTRFSNLFVIGKLQALNITGYGNAGGHLRLEGAGNDPYGLTLRTIGESNTKNGIEIDPSLSTTIKGDLSINARSAVTTGSYQKTASAGDLTADGTITAKTGMKVTKPDGDTTTEIMSVDSTGMKVSATSSTEEGATTGGMSVDSSGMKVSIGDGKTTKDVVAVDSTGMKVDGETTSTRVVSNSVSTNFLRVYTTGTDDSKQYIDFNTGVIKCVHSANLILVGNDNPNAHSIVIGSHNYPISLRKGSTNLLTITTSGANFQVPITAYREADFISSISAPSFIEKDSVSIGGSNEVPDHFNYFGKFNYVIQWHNEEVTNANYVVDLFAGMDNGTVTLPKFGKTTSRYSIINCTTNTLNVAINFDLSSHWYDIEKGIAFLVPNHDEANFNTSLNRYNVASFDVCIEKLEGVSITPNVDGTGDVTTPLQAYTVRYTNLADCFNPSR
jgi:hypothetical protein